MELSPVTNEAQDLIETCPKSYLPFYEEHLPFWADHVMAEIREVLKAGGYPDKNKSLRDIQYFYPSCYLQGLCFSQQLANQIPNIISEAARYNPLAYAVDLHYRIRNYSTTGELPNYIMSCHYESVRLSHIALNILGHYKEVLREEFIGSQIARLILFADSYEYAKDSLNRLRTLRRFKNLKDKHADSFDGGFHTAIAELFKKSAGKAEQLSALPIIQDAIEDDDYSHNVQVLRKIIDSAAPKTQQLQDALAGKYRILGDRVTSRTIDFTLAKANEDEHTTHLDELTAMTVKQESQVIEAIELSMSIDSLGLSGAERKIIDFLLNDPEMPDTELAERLEVHRNTIRKYRRGLERKLKRLF